MGNILITGANGFVGSYLVEEALQKGHQVFAGIRSTSNLKYIKDKPIHLVNMDITDIESLKLQFERIYSEFGSFDAVIHNAGITEAVYAKDYFQVNYQGTVNLLEALKQTKMLKGKFVFISSLAAIGPAKDFTFSLNEKTPANPTSWYGHSKLKAEKHVQSQEGLDYLILRPTGIYGPRNMGYLSYFKLINNHLEIYLNTRFQLLSFVYVEDLAELIVLSLAKKTNSKVLIISDGSNYSCNVFAGLLKKKLHKKTLRLVIPKAVVYLLCSVNTLLSKISQKPFLVNSDKYHELIAKSWSCSSEEMKRDLGFTPKYNLEEGISKSINWYKENKYL